MKIRMTIGFITGVLVVVGLWWMLQSKKTEEKNMAAGSIHPAVSLYKITAIKETAEPALPASQKIQETAQAVQPSETGVSKDSPDQPPENKADTKVSGEKPADEKAEVRPEEPQTAVTPVLPDPPDLKSETASDTSSIVSKKTDPVLPEEPTSDTEFALMPETYNLEKHFFWKPFSLKSKAEKFAGYISDKSGVDCRVKKTGVAQYQVYYLYENEADQAVKTALIKKTGLKL